MNSFALLKRLFTKQPPPAPPVEVTEIKRSTLRSIPPSTKEFDSTISPTLSARPNLKRVRTPRSPRSSPPNRSPLIRRNPRMLGEGEYFISDGEKERRDRESTPRFKRLRRSGGTSDFDGASIISRTSREGTVISGTTLTGLLAGNLPFQQHPSTVLEETDEALDEAQQLENLTSEHGFTNQEALLFLRIKNRGFEPLMPAHWQVDFGTMPDNLFFPPNEIGYIDSITLQGTFKATNAFQALVNIGGMVRAKQEVKLDPEGMVMTILRKYICWSVEDVKANLKDCQDIHPRIVLGGSYGKGAKHCEARMQRKLVELGAELRTEEEYLASLGHPREDTLSATIYGLAVSGCVVALVSLDAHNTSSPMPKTLSLLDFSDTTLDFWNAVAVGLLVIAGRDDELERNEFYNSRNLEKPLISEIKRRGWERRRTQERDEDA